MGFVGIFKMAMGTIWVQNFNFGASLVAAVQNIFFGGHY